MAPSILVTLMMTTTAFQMNATSTQPAAPTAIQDGQDDTCQTDTDRDGSIDPCDTDDDGDGIPDECDIDTTGGADCDQDGEDDLCQTDSDQDGLIDPCDPDDDNDGIPDECDVDTTGGLTVMPMVRTTHARTIRTAMAPLIHVTRTMTTTIFTTNATSTPPVVLTAMRMVRTTLAKKIPTVTVKSTPAIPMMTARYPRTCRSNWRI